MLYYTSKGKEFFYDVLKEIKKNSIRWEHRYDGDYSIMVYQLENGEVWEYTVNDSLGIPYSLEMIFPFKNNK